MKLLVMFSLLATAAIAQTLQGEFGRTYTRAGLEESTKVGKINLYLNSTFLRTGEGNYFFAGPGVGFGHGPLKVIFYAFGNSSVWRSEQSQLDKDMESSRTDAEKTARYMGVAPGVKFMWETKHLEAIAAFTQLYASSGRHATIINPVEVMFQLPKHWKTGIMGEWSNLGESELKAGPSISYSYGKFTWFGGYLFGHRWDKAEETSRNPNGLNEVRGGMKLAFGGKEHD